MLSMVLVVASECSTLCVTVAMMSLTCFMLSTIFWLERSTSLIAVSTTRISPSSCLESSVIAPTLVFTVFIFPNVSPIRSKMVVMESVILSDVSSK